MPQEIIRQLIDRGWTYSVISGKTGISEVRLRSGDLRERDELEIYHLADVAGVDVDDELEG